ncbi:AAA family ATPase [Desulfobacca acetoxidans]|uniref:AAA family ATPase n=1 Tax=Desulfobacca acetoxidans (strain ATCC 700848 / DSM 11109 / ASRB2) TaxID=880072 RepID=F2NG05_DESAR|nr:AAA family ATPase [Desulfobacca acetoxidans]AEB08418.1 hypothetical protein Desac_0532 [Desulfobacca acetoxidans DSM 11109]
MADKIINIADEARQRIKAEKLQNEHGIKTITGADLAGKVFPPIRWAVPGLLPEGYGILGGRPKIGKSWLAFDIALAVASGGYAIGSNEYPVDPGTALYLALEDHERRLQERQAVLLNGQAGGPERLHLTTEWKRLHEGGIEALEAYLTAYNDCRLVTVDTLARVKPRLKRGADAYENDMEIGGKLQAIAHKYHVCLLAVHHTRKSKSETGDFIDELAGSTGITGAPDFVAQLSRGRRENTGILEITGKDIPEIELALKFENCLWTYLGNAKEVRISQNQETILNCLKNSSEPLKPKEISQMTDIGENYVKNILKILLDTELIKKTGYGKYCI